MLFQKEHLMGHYTWADEKSQPVFTGDPTRRLFNRFNGDQVLFIINCSASQESHFTLHDGHILEELILHHLPLQAKSEISVLQWLREIKQHHFETSNPSVGNF